jgi:hypothetical protein
MCNCLEGKERFKKIFHHLFENSRGKFILYVYVAGYEQSAHKINNEKR